MDDTRATGDRLKLNESVACERCGKFGALEIGSQWLCATCIEGSGSCCPEFGADDLWTGRDSKSSAD